MQQSVTYKFSIPTPGEYFDRQSGLRRYELSNHLGNVLATISDKKLPVEDSQSPGEVEYYAADVMNVSDYYPFGMLQPQRQWSAGSGYRWGFNAQERDDEIYGIGNPYTAEFLQYDPRLGRRWNVDPVDKEWESKVIVL